MNVPMNNPKAAHAPRRRLAPLRMPLLAAGFACAALALSACTSVLPRTPPETYDLTAPAGFEGLGSTRAQILILEPSAVKVFDSEQIVIRPSATEIQYLGNAQWSDRLPKLLQARLVESFENTGKARAVARPGDGLVIDYQIVTDIRAFQANIGSGISEARVSLSVKLVSDRTGKVVRTAVFEESAPLAGASGLQVVTALDQAFDKAVRKIISWTFAAI